VFRFVFLWYGKSILVLKVHIICFYEYFGLDNLEGKTLGLLGLSFKPETKDMRESSVLTILPGLIEKSAKIRLMIQKLLKKLPGD